MKKIILFSLQLWLLLFSQSCDVNEPENQNETIAFSLSVGNKYSFRHSSHIIGSPNFASWFTSKRILSDTLVNGTQYFVFDNGLKLRADEKIVYSLNSGSENIYFSFNTNVGDTITFESNRYLLKEIRTSNNFFGESHLLYTLSNEAFSPDSIVRYSFILKFGLVDFNRHYSNIINSFYLDGAIIKDVGYGRLKN